jgi:hypothetical protein
MQHTLCKIFNLHVVKKTFEPKWLIATTNGCNKKCLTVAKSLLDQKSISRNAELLRCVGCRIFFAAMFRLWPKQLICNLAHVRIYT